MYLGHYKSETVGVQAIGKRLEEQFPALKGNLLQGSDFRPDLAVAIDGEVAFDLLDRVGANSEVHFIPPIAGG